MDHVRSFCDIRVFALHLHERIRFFIAEGIVRIYRQYNSDETVELVTAFRALNNVIPAEWQQPNGSLLVGGDATTIRVWDANQEICLPVRIPFPLVYDVLTTLYCRKLKLTL